MNVAELIKLRLMNQQIADTAFRKPEDMVGWMVAMQAQEFALAKWAIGLRLPGSREADIDDAFNRGVILRTHLLRPTWHFVTPHDIRWLLMLTAPHVQAANAYWYRKFGLDQSLFSRTSHILARELQGGRQRTRAELNAIFAKQQIIAEGLRLGYIFMHAELEGIICSGARQGKQFTYALLEERVPAGTVFSREEALAELTNRYFASRGPATLQDYASWSGLAMKDVKAGVAMLPSHFVQEAIDGQNYIFAPTVSEDRHIIRDTVLLPDYDEYGMSYKNRSALFGPHFSQNGTPRYKHMLVVDGVIGGTWQRSTKNNSADIDTSPIAAWNESEQQKVDEAVQRYRDYNQ